MKKKIGKIELDRLCWLAKLGLSQLYNLKMIDPYTREKWYEEIEAINQKEEK